MCVCVLKDTRLLGVGHRRRAARRHVAVEGHLQRVAVGRVVQQAAQETPARPSLHHVSVEGRVGLTWDDGRHHDTHTHTGGTSCFLLKNVHNKMETKKKSFSLTIMMLFPPPQFYVTASETSAKSSHLISGSHDLSQVRGQEQTNMSSLNARMRDFFFSPPAVK